jgi:hypothetical protein
MLLGTDAEFGDMTGVSPWLEIQASMQSQVAQTSPVRSAYQRMLNGDLEGVAADAEGSVGEELLRMVAASDGATDEMIDLALALDTTQGLNSDSIWVAIGLAIRHGRPTDELLSAADEILGPNAVVLREFFANLSDTPAAEEALKGATNLEARGAAYAGGVVALGQRAPEEWREGAKRLLFITERPYFE